MVICDYIRLVWQSETVHLDKPVWIYIIFIDTGVHYFTKPPERTVCFWYGLEVNQFLSNNRILKDLLKRFCNLFISFQ